MSEGKHYRCYYEAEWPVDEYDRPGGLYSLADLPVVQRKKLVRRGLVIAKTEEHQKYKVKDMDLRCEVWVDMKDVQVGEIHNGDAWSDWRKKKGEVE